VKLAEALMTRADLQRRVQQLRSRIVANARYQEGEEPAEDATALITEVADVLERIEALVVAINLSNAVTRLGDGRSMTAALARRETLRTRHSVLTAAADAAQGAGAFRQMRSELRNVAALPVMEVRREADLVARELRELDVEIQRTNWEVDLQA
jgi:hypothetical protein